jgi:hypothetical protein
VNFCWTVRRHNPEDSALRSKCFKNMLSHEMKCHNLCSLSNIITMEKSTRITMGGGACSTAGRSQVYIKLWSVNLKNNRLHLGVVRCTSPRKLLGEWRKSLALVGNHWSDLWLGRFTPGNQPPVTTVWETRWTPEPSERCGEEKNLLSVP